MLSRIKDGLWRTCRGKGGKIESRLRGSVDEVVISISHKSAVGLDRSTFL